MKKQYVTPELDLLILEQTDIITVSYIEGGEGAVRGENSGEGHQFGWD